MPVMTVEPAELGEILASHHLPALSEFEQRVLTARCWGCGYSDLAPIVGYAPDALRRVFDRLQGVILGPTGMKRDLARTRPSGEPRTAVTTASTVERCV
ncbi:MAG: hypothetical protein C0506_16070 [Anaerolinea sp.]|nr:hypothetical protein [Anaerolinea sp.]